MQLFSDIACVVFVSLAENFGCVMKSTKNVRDVLGHSFADLARQNINIIMSSSIAQIHDQLLENYIKKGAPSQGAYERNQFFFSKQKSGFIVPLLRYLKLDFFEEDLGVLAFLEKYTIQEHFLFVSGSYKLEDTTKKFFEDFLMKTAGVHYDQCK